jgi:integrase
MTCPRPGVHHLHWSALSSIRAIILASDEAVKGLPAATALNDQVVHGWGATWLGHLLAWERHERGPGPCRPPGGRTPGRWPRWTDSDQYLVAMQILRHSRINITMEIYTKVPDEMTRAALKRLEDNLDQPGRQGHSASEVPEP